MLDGYCFGGFNFLCLLHLLQHIIQLRKALRQEVFELLQVLLQLGKFLGLDMVEIFPSLFFCDQKVTLHQDLEIFGHHLPAAVEVLDERIGCQGLDCQQQQDCPPARVRQRLEYIPSHIFPFLRNHSVANIAEMISKSNRLVKKKQAGHPTKKSNTMCQGKL